MMRCFVFIAALCGLIILTPVPVAYAKASVLSIDLAHDYVDITSGFNGAHLNLFGVHDKPGDVVVTITGPLRNTVVRRKENVFGIWMNRRSMQFHDVPSYYGVAASQSLNKIAKDDVLKKFYIGVPTLRFNPEGVYKKDLLPDFQAAMIRNKQSQGLYGYETEDIKFISDHFFRTSFYIPSNAPVGVYKIKTHLFQNGQIAETKEIDVRVAQVGLGANIFNFAQDYPFAYGFLCVVFALSAGWLSSSIRQRLR